MEESTATIIFFIIVIVTLYIAAWIGEIFRWRRAQHKTRAAKHTVDATFWLYDSKGEVKRLGHELRELTRKERKGA
jgi:hypothetical protein